MKTLLNLIWLVGGGLLTALLWALAGIVLFITIIGIPFGLQAFKYSELTLTPFGKEVETDFSKRPIANVIWMILVGWVFAVVYLVIGVLYCITIIGIPFGLQWFKFIKLSLMPFGANIH